MAGVVGSGLNIKESGSGGRQNDDRGYFQRGEDRFEVRIRIRGRVGSQNRVSGQG